MAVPVSMTDGPAQLRAGCVRQDHGGLGGRGHGPQDDHDPSHGLLRKPLPSSGRHLPQGALHGLQPSVEGAWQTDRADEGRDDTKLHTITDSIGRPIRFFITVGQVSDYTGARALMESLPSADWLLGDRGYDADWFRKDLANKGIIPCILKRRSRDKPVRNDKRRYKRRSGIEIIFGRLKDWRRDSLRSVPEGLPVSNRLAARALFWL